MVYDKREEFKRIDDTMLRDIRIECNRHQIPFFWIAPVYDDGKGTSYKVAIDTNKCVDENKQYACNALVPGSMGIDLTDDLIRDLIKVLNGFKVVLNDDRIVMSSNDMTPSRLLSGEGITYDDEEGGFFMDDEDDGGAFSMEVETMPVNPEKKKDTPSIDTKKPERHDVMMTTTQTDEVDIKIGFNDSLPKLEEDYIDEDPNKKEKKEGEAAGIDTKPESDPIEKNDAFPEAK